MTKYKRAPELDDRTGTRWFMDVKGFRATLSSIMEFDHVIEVHADGSVSDNAWAWRTPELHDGVLMQPEPPPAVQWSLVGHSSQQGGGQIMHNSETITGGLADEILETPGYYVAIVCNWLCDCEAHDMIDGECSRDHTEGWAVAFRPLAS